MRAVSLNRLALYVGLFFVVVYAAIAYLTWKSGLEAFSSFLAWTTWCPAIFGALIGMGLLWRERNGTNLLLFKKGMQYAFIAYIVYEIGYALTNIVLYDMLDKTLYARVLEYNLQKEQAVLNRMGTPDKSISDAIERTRQDAQKGISAIQVMIGFGQSLLIDFLKSMVVAVAIQRKAPAGAEMPFDFGQPENVSSPAAGKD